MQERLERALRNEKYIKEQSWAGLFIFGGEAEILHPFNGIFELDNLQNFCFSKSLWFMSRFCLFWKTLIVDQMQEKMVSWGRKSLALRVQSV